MSSPRQPQTIQMITHIKNIIAPPLFNYSFLISFFHNPGSRITAGASQHERWSKPQRTAMLTCGNIHFNFSSMYANITFLRLSVICRVIGYCSFSETPYTPISPLVIIEPIAAPSANRSAASWFSKHPRQWLITRLLFTK